MPSLPMETKRQAAREVIDILAEISTLLVTIPTIFLSQILEIYHAKFQDHSLTSDRQDTEAFGRSSGRKATRNQPAANISEDNH